ncbi:zinc finger protein 331-like [Mercenaria mercenaria]|uniref:zinc finger protein 331-like n=1 Tax=Mercenaria mercenaria TaxID=6596 RepID=UPI00234E49B9|nr:zinc finger protein 331-like [Mercenaria mercenaria]
MTSADIHANANRRHRRLRQPPTPTQKSILLMSDANSDTTNMQLIDYKKDTSRSDKISVHLLVVAFEREPDAQNVKDFRDLLDEYHPDIELPYIDPNEIYGLFQTSGSTGVPKLVAHVHLSTMKIPHAFGMVEDKFHKGNSVSVTIVLQNTARNIDLVSMYAEFTWTLQLFIPIVKGVKYGVRHHHTYTKSQIDAALKHYTEQQKLGKKFSMRRLAKMFSVPLTTLFNQVRSASGKLQKNIICEVCGQTFIYQHQLKQHVEQQHEGRRSVYTCHLCSKSFLFRARLQHHINMHNDERPYMCGKSYFSPQSRYPHELQCQSKYPRPYQCTKCGLSFKVQSALNRHNAAKHGAPQYSCECGQAFGWSQSFRRHRKTCKKVQKAISDEHELQRIVESIQQESFVIQEDVNVHMPLEYVYIHQ